MVEEIGMNRIHELIKKTALLFVLLSAITTISYTADGKENSKPIDQKVEKIKDKKGDFVKGAQLWAQNCSRCHNYRNPKDYNDELWKPVIYHMRIRGGFTGQETRDILEFLQKSN